MSLFLEIRFPFDHYLISVYDWGLPLGYTPLVFVGMINTTKKFMKSVVTETVLRFIAFQFGQILWNEVHCTMVRLRYWFASALVGIIDV